MEDDMNDETVAFGPRLRAGQTVSLCEALDGATVQAEVVSGDGNVWTVQLEGPNLSRSLGVFLRCVDDDGVAWGVPVDLLTLDGIGLIRADRGGEWERVLGRAAVRVSARESVIGTLLMGDMGARRVYSLSVVDVSATGCRALLVGRVPALGEVLILEPEHGGAWHLRARVSRRVAGAFGRAEIGLRFELQTHEDRQVALAWRDRLAGASRYRSAA